MKDVYCDYKPPFFVCPAFAPEDPGYDGILEKCPELLFFSQMCLDDEGNLSKLDDETFRFLRYKIGKQFGLKAIDVLSPDIQVVLRHVRELYEISTTANNISC